MKVQGIEIDWNNARQCNRCLCLFTASAEFFRRKSKDKSGFNPTCKFCQRHQETIRYKTDPVFRNKKIASDKVRTRNPVASRRWYLQTTYSISLEEYTNKLEQQGGVCAICEATENRSLHVDHCHNTGRIRGLLCSRCNTGIGQFRDNLGMLRKAVEYLESYEGE